MNIGTQLEHLRKGHGWTLRDLSAATNGLSISFLSDIERGRTVPSIDTVVRLSEAFGMSVSVFMGGADLEINAEERALLEAYRAGDLAAVARIVLARIDGVSDWTPFTDIVAGVDEDTAHGG